MKNRMRRTMTQTPIFPTFRGQSGSLSVASFPLWHFPAQFAHFLFLLAVGEWVVVKQWEGEGAMAFGASAETGITPPFLHFPQARAATNKLQSGYLDRHAQLGAWHLYPACISLSRGVFSQPVHRPGPTHCRQRGWRLVRARRAP